MDLPQGFPRHRLAEVCKAAGLVEVAAPEVVCTEFGDCTARKRLIRLYTRPERAPQHEVTALHGGAAHPRGCGSLWTLAGRLSLHEHRLPTGEDKRITLAPTISTSGDRLMPWPLGTLESLDEGRRTRHVLHDPRGPCHTVRGKPDPVKAYSNTLLWADGHVRRLSPKELWHAQGGTDTGWVLLREDGWKIDELLQVAARALPPATARAAVQWALRALQDDVPPLDERPKVGSGHDPERQANDAALAA